MDDTSVPSGADMSSQVETREVQTLQQRETVPAATYSWAGPFDEATAVGPEQLEMNEIVEAPLKEPLKGDATPVSSGLMFIEHTPPDPVKLHATRRELALVEERVLQAVDGAEALRGAEEDGKKAVAEALEKAKEAIAAEQAKNVKLRRPRPALPAPAVKPPPKVPFEATKRAIDASLERKRKKAEEEAKEAERQRQAAKPKPIKRPALPAPEGSVDAGPQEATNEDLDEELPLKRRLFEEAVARSRARHVRVECPACGERVQLVQLARHEERSCINRKVPCKNWELGCDCLVRMQTRKMHEQVEHLLGARMCLRFSGGQGFISINEEDKEPPYTVEYWVYRAPISEDTFEKITMILDLYQKMLLSKGETKMVLKRVEVGM